MHQFKLRSCWSSEKECNLEKHYVSWVQNSFWCWSTRKNYVASSDWSVHDMQCLWFGYRWRHYFLLFEQLKRAPVNTTPGSPETASRVWGLTILWLTIRVLIELTEDSPNICLLLRDFWLAQVLISTYFIKIFRSFSRSGDTAAEKTAESSFDLEIQIRFLSDIFLFHPN